MGAPTIQPDRWAPAGAVEAPAHDYSQAEINEGLTRALMQVLEEQVVKQRCLAAMGASTQASIQQQAISSRHTAHMCSRALPLVHSMVCYHRCVANNNKVHMKECDLRPFFGSAGQVLAGRPHGVGQYWASTQGQALQLVYEGEFVRGVRHGQGTAYYGSRGEVYSGQWVDGRRTGPGG